MATDGIRLALYHRMIRKVYNLVSYHHTNPIIKGGLLGLALLFFMSLSYTQAQPAKPLENQVISGFNDQLKQYGKAREQVVSKLEKPATKSEPAKIKAYQTALEENLRTARINAKQGDLFTPEVAEHIRQVIRQEFHGKRLAKLRKNITEAQTKGVPLRVNHPYPEQKEAVEMPPTLLLKLPALPKELRYRFVGSDLLLVDREALLILDYMTNALP